MPIQTRETRISTSERSSRLLTRRPTLVGPRCLILLAALACLPMSAHAQVNPFHGYRGPTLSRPDLDAGRQAAGRLLGADPKPVGATETWTGSTSGNSGVLTVERVYQRQGHECRAVRSRIIYRQGTERSFLLQACRVGGRWRLAD